MHPALIALPICLVFAFGSTWVLHNLAVSRAGGWGRLAGAYPSTGGSPEKTWPGCSLMLGESSRYKNGVELGVSEAGLHLTASGFYRFGHAPLVIPWADLEMGADGSDFWGEFTPLSVPKLDGLSLKVYSDMRAELRAAREAAGC